MSELSFRPNLNFDIIVLRRLNTLNCKVEYLLQQQSQSRLYF